MSNELHCACVLSNTHKTKIIQLHSDTECYLWHMTTDPGLPFNVRKRRGVINYFQYIQPQCVASGIFGCYG